MKRRRPVFAAALVIARLEVVTPVGAENSVLSLPGFGASIVCVHRLFHARARIPDCAQFDKGAWAPGRAASLATIAYVLGAAAGGAELV